MRYSRNLGKLEQRFSALLFLAVALLGSAFGSSRLNAWAGELHHQYTQQITIDFRDPEAAQKAVVAIAPLFNDHRRAVSCRWDDNWTSDNETTRDLMEEYGIRGTWYLNDRSFSPDTKRGDYLPVAKTLLKGGNSVGGHSLTHPYLTYFHSNRMFAEMLGVRIVWEAALDRPVTSYAYSFIDLRPEPEGKAVLQRSLDTLQRAGYHHIAEYINLIDDIELKHEFSPIMPPENNDFDVFKEAINWAYHDQRLTQEFPMITNSMHAWYGTARLQYGYDELRKRLELLSGLDDVWHCNQNQYAAYRRQYRHAKLTPIERTGSTLRLRLTRPTLLDLNDEMPLTLAISGVQSDAIKRVYCPDAAVDMSDRQTHRRSLFHLGHSRHQKLPSKIAHLANPGNKTGEEDLPTDPDFPALRGAISVNEESLHLSLRCDESQFLSDIRVVWRVPIGWGVETMIHEQEGLDGESLRLSQPLIPIGERGSRWGQTHFAAQVDFQWNGQPGRIHFTCQTPGEKPDDSLPLNGFAILGPIPNDQWDTAEFVQMMQQDGDCERWTLADGSEVHWRIDSRDGYVNHQWLNPEYVRTMGTWDHYSPTYVMRSEVYSPFARKARLLTSHAALRSVLVNGQLVDSETVNLKAGKNQIVLVYPGSALSVETQRLAGCFVRLADPETGQRWEDIRYHAF